MKRALQLCTLGALVALGLSCGGGTSSLDDTEAVVNLSVTDIDYGGATVDVCSFADPIVRSLSITSNPKDPDEVLTSQQDVILTRWVITPYRTDGGTVASPRWIRDDQIFVPAGGTTTLDTWNYYSWEFYDEPPLLYLFPENGGFDIETGERTIRQAFHVEWFGETVSGKRVSVDTHLQFDFICVGK